jgi:hypothetical protein
VAKHGVSDAELNEGRDWELDTRNGADIRNKMARLLGSFGRDVDG